jgi:hypothetical protein
MDTYRKPIKACPEQRSLRAPVRALLKRGARGDIDGFLALVELYFDLISEHLHLCHLGPDDALQKTETILREGWKHLPCFKRLSDWERFLAHSLMAVEVGGTGSPGALRLQSLVELDSDAKFALIAFDLENWSYPWLSLALRIPPRHLRSILFTVRCRLLQIELDHIPRRLRQCLELVSADLDGQLSSGQQKQLLRKLCASEEAKDFKSHWLAFRCQLIELRQQIRLGTEVRDDFLRNLALQLASEDMVRPSLTARLRNLFSYSELDEVEAAPNDFHFGR